MFLYRPSIKHLDFDIVSLSKPTLLIPDNCLVDGRWNIKFVDNITEFIIYKKNMNY